MGTLKVNGIRHTGASSDAISLDSGGTCTANLTNLVSDRNFIINGDAKISQRATAAGSITSGGYYAVDRWYVTMASAGTWTMYQDADVPSGYGFSKSVSMDVNTANTSLSASSRAMLSYRLEGHDVQPFCKGTSNAKKFAVSFWVKSGKTGTYVLELYDHDNSRHICQAYSVSSANTWEQKKLVLDNETSNAFGNDTGKSLELQFYLVAGSDYTSGTLATSWAAASNANRAVGQVNVADSTSNKFFLTGVQLETGDYNSEFEHRSYNDEWLRCARYFYMLADGSETDGGVAMSQAYSTTQAHACVRHPVKMRAAPSVYVVEGTNYFKWIGQGASDLFDDINSNGYPTTTASEIYLSGNLSCTAGAAGWFRTANSAARIGFNAEL